MVKHDYAILSDQALKKLKTLEKELQTLILAYEK